MGVWRWRGRPAPAMPARLGAPAGSAENSGGDPARRTETQRRTGRTEHRAATVGWRGGAVAAQGSHSGLGLSQPPAPGHGGQQTEDTRRTQRPRHPPLSRSGSRHGHAVTVQHTDTCKCKGCCADIVSSQSFTRKTRLSLLCAICQARNDNPPPSPFTSCQ